MYQYKATVVSVYDGDTFTAIVDLGFNVTFRDTFRLHGIDTPEMNRANQKALATKARDFVRERILDKEVLINTIKADSRDKYGRYLATVKYRDGDTMKDLGIELINVALARAYDGGKREEW